MKRKLARAVLALFLSAGLLFALLEEEEETVAVQKMDGQEFETVVQTMILQGPTAKQQIMRVQLSVTEVDVTGGAAIRCRVREEEKAEP